MILAIDTSRGTSVAVVAGDAVLVRLQIEDTRRHAEVIDALLAEALDGRRDAIELVVAGLGPGAFTGLRVGIAAARAAALGLGVPWTGVCSHDAVGVALAGDVQVTTDVRRRERAWSRYVDGARVDGPHLAPADAVPTLPGARRVDVDWIDAAGLAAAAADPAARAERAIYLREPDAALPSARKRVTG